MRPPDEDRQEMRTVEVYDARLTNRIREIQIPVDGEVPVDDEPTPEQVERTRAAVAALVARFGSEAGNT